MGGGGKESDVIILLIVVKEYDFTASLTHLVGACRGSEFRKNITFWTAKSRRKNNSVSNTSNSVIH